MALDFSATNIREEALKSVSTSPDSMPSKKRKTKNTSRAKICQTGDVELELMRKEAARLRAQEDMRLELEECHIYMAGANVKTNQ